MHTVAKESRDSPLTSDVANEPIKANRCNRKDLVISRAKILVSERCPFNLWSLKSTQSLTLFDLGPTLNPCQTQYRHRCCSLSLSVHPALAQEP
jgi:hypothetical protein